MNQSESRCFVPWTQVCEAVAHLIITSQSTEHVSIATGGVGWQTQALTVLKS